MPSRRYYVEKVTELYEELQDEIHSSSVTEKDYMAAAYELGRILFILDPQDQWRITRTPKKKD